MPDTPAPTAPLTPSEVAKLLLAAPQQLRAEILALPDAAARWHPAENEWCALEVVGHLVEADRRAFAGRIGSILEQPGRKLTVWDEAAVARERRDCEKAAVTLLAALEESRRESVQLLAGLQAGDLSQHGEHPTVGTLTVSDLLHEWVHHDRNHMRQIAANVQGYVWGNMGNGKRFITDPGTGE